MGLKIVSLFLGLALVACAAPASEGAAIAAAAEPEAARDFEVTLSPTSPLAISGLLKFSGETSALEGVLYGLTGPVALAAPASCDGALGDWRHTVEPAGPASKIATTVATDALVGAPHLAVLAEGEVVACGPARVLPTN